MKMRTSLLALLTLLTASAQVSASVTTTKVSDGTVAVCKKAYDVHKRSNLNGVYRAKAHKINITEDGIAEIDLILIFQRCATKGAKVGFVSHSPLKKVETQVYGLGKKFNDIEISTESAVVKAYKDGVYKLLQENNLKDKSAQAHRLSIPVESLMSDMDKKELEFGNKAQGSFDIMIQKQIRLENLSKNYSMRTTSNLGAFRIRFDIERNGETLEATLK